MRSWWVLALVIAAGLLSYSVFSGSCNQPEQAEDEFPPANDLPPT